MYLLPDVRGFGSSVVNNSTTSNSIEVLSIGTAYLIFYLVPLLPTDRLATIPPPARLAFFWASRNLGPIFLRPAELFVGFASASTELAPPNDYDIEGRDITEDGWPLGFQLWSLTA
jgi:hypothetical protein